MGAARSSTAAGVERSYLDFLTALWVLVRTAGSGAAADAVDAAAAACARALAAAFANESHFVLQERSGALFANGARMRPGVDTFAALAGITDLMAAAGVGELLWMPPADHAGLALLARTWHAAHRAVDLHTALAQGGCAGIHVGPAAVTSEPPPDAIADGSQLGAVCSLQRFAGELAATGPLGGRRARAALQRVLQALMHSPCGLAPLQLLVDRAARRSAVQASVLAVRAADGLGWSDARTAGAGIQALLADSTLADGDAEVAQLAAASRSVAAGLGGSPADAADALLGELQAADRLSPALARAMAQALQS
jgi:hypothetical protein